MPFCVIGQSRNRPVEVDPISNKAADVDWPVRELESTAIGAILSEHVGLRFKFRREGELHFEFGLGIGDILRVDVRLLEGLDVVVVDELDGARLRRLHRRRGDSERNRGNQPGERPECNPLYQNVFHNLPPCLKTLLDLMKSVNYRIFGTDSTKLRVIGEYTIV